MADDVGSQETARIDAAACGFHKSRPGYTMQIFRIAGGQQFMDCGGGLSDAEWAFG